MAAATDDGWQLIDHPAPKPAAYTWVGHYAGAPCLGTPAGRDLSHVVVPVPMAVLHADVAHGFQRTPPLEQLRRDIPRQDLRINGRRIRSVSDVPWSQLSPSPERGPRLLAMFLTQAAFAFPYRYVVELLPPGACAVQCGPAYRVRVWGGGGSRVSFSAHKDFRVLHAGDEDPAPGRPWLLARVALETDGLHDPHATAAVHVTLRLVGGGGDSPTPPPHPATARSCRAGGDEFVRPLIKANPGPCPGDGAAAAPPTARRAPPRGASSPTSEPSA